MMIVFNFSLLEFREFVETLGSPGTEEQQSDCDE